MRDTGIGLEAEAMGRLFQSFSQADSSTTRRYGGTGLGLAISKRLAELMGGSMQAESEGPGRGSTFTFTIEAPIAEVAPARSHSIAGPQPALVGRRMLVVDDNATNRRVLTLQAGKWGMTTRDTDSPAEALAWLTAGEPFDLAVVDMHMPQMDGVMLARRMRDLRPALPRVLWTSLGRREGGDDDTLFAATLGKPVRQSQLFDTLVNLLSGEAAPRAPRATKASIDPDLGRRHPLRILLAEDNVVNQKLAMRLLQQMGYRADLASNGIEVIESIERQVYDVVLMDVQMPEMDGLEATRRINARWSRRRPAAHRGDDRQRHAGRPRDVPRSRHGRLPHQAHPRGPAGRRAGRLVRTHHSHAGLVMTSPIDPAIFSDLRDTTGSEFVRELVDTFLQEAPLMLADLRDALATGDADRFRRAAHSLKSNGNTFGARELGNLARDLEVTGVVAVAARGPQALEPIFAEYARAAATLEDLRDE